MANTTPNLTGFAASVTFAENTVNAAPQILDSDVTFTDPDDNFDTGTLTVTGLLAEDTVAIGNQGTGAGQIGFSAGNVSYEGILIGTASGGAGAMLTVTFNADATSVAIDALIQDLTYANSSDAPTASHTLTVTVTDENGAVTVDPSVTHFILATGADDPFNGVDIGRFSKIAFADLDNDGDVDAWAVNSDGGKVYYLNTGSADAPVFTAQGGATPFDGIGISGKVAPSFADLDGNGTIDLVIAGNGGISYYKNTGTVSAAVFTQQSGGNNPFNGFDIAGQSAVVAFGDVDGDGLIDAVIGHGGSLRFFKNTGDASNPVFTEQTGIDNPFNGFGFQHDVAPTVGDVDGDGDLDVLLGTFGGSTAYLKNIGSSTAPVFQSAPFPFVGVPAGAYTAPVLVDLDGDGLLDAVFGEFDGTFPTFFGAHDQAGVSLTINVTAENDAPQLSGLATSVTFGENAVNATPQILDSDVTFTDPDNNFNGGTLTVTGLLAEDSVGIGDQGAGAGQIGFSAGNVSYQGTLIGTASGGAGATLTVTFNAAATSTAIDALIQDLTYGNSSDDPTASRTLTVTVTDAAGAVTLGPPSFTEQTGGANPFNGVDVGEFSTAFLADVDGDGDLDAVVGAFDGSLHYLKNTGTTTAPVFAEQTGGNNPFNAIDIGYSSNPVLGDLDGDGDLDLVVGTNNLRTLQYFQNTGTANAPVFVQQGGGNNPFNGLDTGYLATPALADLDGDGDLDAVVGDNYGTQRYFQNTGTASAPAFVSVTGAANPFNGVNVGSYASAAFTDLDGDGDLDVVFGRSNGGVHTFLNTGTTTAPVFVEQFGADNPFNFISALAVDPAFADLDGDGHVDLVTGERFGALLTFQNTPAAGVPIVVNVTAEDDVGVTIVGSKNDDLVDATHTVAGQPLPTGAADIITGEKGNDDLSGLGGGDTIDGGKGNDTLHGGAGNDILQAEGKDGEFDIFDGGPDTDTLQVLGKGSTTLAGFDATADSIEIWLGNGKEVKGSDVGDLFDFSGLTSVTGLAFVDGGKGDDTLVGSAFADDLRGGKGDDTLRGGGGDDQLAGGKGTDGFVFNVGDGNDTIMDLSFDKKLPVLDDHIDLTGFGTDYMADINAHMTQVGKNVVIDFGGGDTLTILKTTIAILDAHQADFHLV